MRLKILLISFLAPLLLIAQASTAGAVNLFGDACSGSAANSPTCQQASKQGGSNNPVTGSNSIINAAVNIIAAVAGLAAVIMIIISGLRLTTSSGNPEAAKSARSTLTASIIGLAVVALAWTITRFIIDRVVQ